MRILLLLILIVIFQPVSAQKNQAKFQSTLPFEIMYNIEKSNFKKSHNKEYKTRKLRKQNKGYGNKLKLNVGMRFDMLFSSINQQIPLYITDSEVYYKDKLVGNYQFRNENEKFYNTINLQEETVNWVSNEQPVSHIYESAIHNNKKVFGANLEWRFVKRDRMAGRQGFFINTGILFMDKSIPTLEINKMEMLFPVGIGVIIPSNDRLGVELSGNGIFGNQGSLGAKFDFSFVISNLKFGPNFIYTQFNDALNSTSGGLGFHLGFIFPN